MAASVPSLVVELRSLQNKKENHAIIHHYFEVDQADSNVSVANFSLHFCTITAYNGIFQCSLIIARKPTFM